MSSLYFATALEILDYIFIRQTRFRDPVSKSRKIFFVLCKALFHCVIDQVRDGSVNLRRFYAQGTMKFGIEINCCSFLLRFHGNIIAS